MSNTKIEAKKIFMEITEGCKDLTTQQKRVAYKRIIADKVDEGQVGEMMRLMLQEELDSLKIIPGFIVTEIKSKTDERKNVSQCFSSFDQANRVRKELRAQGKEIFSSILDNIEDFNFVYKENKEANEIVAKHSNKK